MNSVAILLCSCLALAADGERPPDEFGLAPPPLQGATAAAVKQAFVSNYRGQGKLKDSIGSGEIRMNGSGFLFVWFCPFRDGKGCQFHGYRLSPVDNKWKLFVSRTAAGVDPAGLSLSFNGQFMSVRDSRSGRHLYKVKTP